MKLSDGLEAIKQAFTLVLNGGMNHMFNTNELERIIKVGFLVNNLTMISDDKGENLVFEYESFKIVVNIHGYEFNFQYKEEMYISRIIEDEVFLKALTSFRRDYKINEILS